MQGRASGEEVLSRVLESLGVEERQYFGISIPDGHQLVSPADGRPHLRADVRSVSCVIALACPAEMDVSWKDGAEASCGRVSVHRVLSRASLPEGSPQLAAGRVQVTGLGGRAITNPTRPGRARTTN